MNLTDSLPKHEYILAIAERVSNQYPSTKGQCEFMANDLVKELKKIGVRSNHVIGNFHLDEPAAFEYVSDKDEDSKDDYVVNHDWVNVEGKILDISAKQFRKYVTDPIPDIVFIGCENPLFNHYEELTHAI
jgi:hypothetical protein